MSAYLTNPENPNVRKQQRGDFDFAEALTTELVELEVPFYYARVATIDFKHLWIPCFQKKMTPKKTAKFLAADIRKAYSLENKTKPE